MRELNSLTDTYRHFQFIPFLMKLYSEGHFPVDKISKTFKVEEFDKALKAMHSGEVIKPIILF